MEHFDRLLRWAGLWEGYNRVQPYPADPIDESKSRLVITPILHDTFIRIDQSWSWKDTPQSGSLLIGYDRETGVASIHWIDTWHNGTRVMPLSGAFNSNGVLIAHGHFAVKDSPDWGWRIELHASDEELKTDMACVHPDGKTEEGGVWSKYQRTSSGV